MLVIHTATGTIASIPGKLPPIDGTAGLSVLVEDLSVLPDGWEEYVSPPPQPYEDPNAEEREQVRQSILALAMELGWTTLPSGWADAIQRLEQAEEAAGAVEEKLAIVKQSQKLLALRIQYVELGGTWSDLAPTT